MSSNYFGVFCDYTASRSDGFKFDDFYVGDPIVDTIAPLIQNVESNSDSSIIINFSEVVDETSATVLTNYLVNSNIGSPSSINYSGNSIELIFSDNFVEGNNYMINVSSIADLSGNIISIAMETFLYYVPRAGDIVVNEIFADPSPQVLLPEAEFIELYNTKSFAINLKNWELKSGSSSYGLFEDFEIPAQGYLVLCADTYFPIYKNLALAYGMSDWRSITDTGDNISLYSNTGVLIDNIDFTNAWYNNNSKCNGGYSLERKNTSSECSGIDNWEASSSNFGGTPGTKNTHNTLAFETLPPLVNSYELIGLNSVSITFSEPMDSNVLQISNYTIDNGSSINSISPLNAELSEVQLFFDVPITIDQTYQLSISKVKDCLGNEIKDLSIVLGTSSYQPTLNDVVFTEVMFDPDPQIGLPNVEYLEIYNRSEHAINLGDLKFFVNSTETNFNYYYLLPGTYLMLCDDKGRRAFDIIDPIMIFDKFPSLGNEASISIFTNEDSCLFNVKYEDNWHANDIKKAGGYSLEMIDLDYPCFEMGNWTSSVDPSGGSPSRVNSVNGINPDETPLKLAEIIYLDAFRIKAVFNEKVDEESLKNATFNIDNSIGQANISGLVTPEKKEILLTLAKELQPGIIYTLTAENLVSCSGIEIDSNNTLPFGVPQNIEVGDIIINEILFDALTNQRDFIELYNKSDKVLCTKDLIIAEADPITDELTDIEYLGLTNKLILPNDYVVFTSDDILLTQTYHVESPYKILEVSGMPSYSSSEGKAVLLRGDLEVLDELTYSDDWHFTFLENDQGVSLERIDFNEPTQDQSNWNSASESVGYATPTYLNSIQITPNFTLEPGDIIINEVLFNPNVGGYDFIELYNTSNKSIPLSELIIAETEDGTVTDFVNLSSLENLTIEPQGYIVLTENSENIFAEYTVLDPSALIEASIPNAPDEGGTIVLLRQDEVIIDELTFLDDWHFALLDDDEGVSLERISFDGNTQDQNNWQSAAQSVGFATPTSINSSTLNIEINENDISVEPEVFSPDNDGTDDKLAIKYNLDRAGYVANIYIFDLEGRQVRHLIKSQTLSQEGFFIWDGLNDNNEKARVGIHLVYTELIDLNGEIKKFKDKCVVAAKL